MTRSTFYTFLRIALSSMFASGLCAPLVVLATPITQADNVVFNSGRLKGLNIDPKQIEQFVHTSRFASGKQRVSLFVNNLRRGDVTALFNENGQLCMDSSLITKAQLVLKDVASPLPEDICPNIDRLFPGSQVMLLPGKTEVHLIVTSTDLETRKNSQPSFIQGGTAAILNYDGFATRNESSTDRVHDYRTLNALAGLNVSDYLFRSSQTYTSNGRDGKLSHQFAYGQKTVHTLESTIQAGQINTVNSVYAGIPLSGVQLFPEDSLRVSAQDSPVRVEGVAYNDARVELRQNGNLLYTTIVPAGPFILTDLPINRQRDVDVAVIENSGTRHEFTVPTAGLESSAFNSSPGYSLAAGRYRTYSGNDTHKPLVITGTGVWPLSRHSSVTGGAVGTTDYQGLGWTLGHRLTGTTSVSVSQLVSNSLTDGKQGTSVSASISTQVLSGLSMSLNTTHNSEGYRDVFDSLYKAPPQERFDHYVEYPDLKKPQQRFAQRTHDQYGASLAWNDPTLGGFAVSSTYITRNNNQSSQYFNGSWSKNFGKAKISLNVQKSTDYSGYNRDGGVSSYLTANMPLGNQTKLYMNNDRQRTRSGLSYEDRINDSVGYQVRADHEDQNHRTNVGVTTNVLSRYAQSGFGYSQTNTNAKSYSGRLSGAIVGHSDGVTLSPYAVDDTFSIISVGDMSGVKVSTPRGPVWTDRSGQAVAPSLAPHRESNVSVNGADLPRNVDIGNSVKKITAGRGSVSRIEFDVVTTRRVVLKVTGPDGNPLPGNLAVHNDQAQYQTNTLKNGNIYFPTLQPGEILTVTLAEDSACNVNYVLPKKADLSKVFETIDATCTLL